MKRLSYLCAAIGLLLPFPLHADEEHPTIVHAISSLEQSKAELEKGEHGFGGHRSKAIEDINDALRELHLALEYAHDHPEAIKPADKP